MPLIEIRENDENEYPEAEEVSKHVKSPKGANSKKKDGDKNTKGVLKVKKNVQATTNKPKKSIVS